MPPKKTTKKPVAKPGKKQPHLSDPNTVEDKVEPAQVKPTPEVTVKLAEPESVKVTAPIVAADKPAP
jgi:hypothetical protein